MPQLQTIYLALGSNLGDRAGYIQAALRGLRAYTQVEATSFLYETLPLYVTEQPKYLNAVCRATTQLTPHELLVALEETMKRVGRVRTLRYGPRVIDIDILFYADQVLDTPELTVPHPRLAERRFVLEPLCDIAPELPHPITGVTMRDLLAQQADPPLPKVMPLGRRLWHWGAKTYLMGILNVTPDSFSGDGLLQRGDDLIAQAVAQAQRFAADGADCVDIGGISTRPGHSLIPVEEELARVIPVLQALQGAVDLPISIDTFRLEVAQAAISAGAGLLNDIWGLRFDSRLADLAAHTFTPLIMMHNRMEPADAAYRQQIQSVPFGRIYEYNDIIRDIQGELRQSLTLAQAAGLPRWLQIIDPGMGFGKTLEQQLTLIRRLKELKELNYPLLFAASRKSFIGKVLGGLPPEERLEGSMATAVLAIERGADLLRVHDVQAMSRVRRLVDAVVR